MNEFLYVAFLAMVIAGVAIMFYSVVGIAIIGIGFVGMMLCRIVDQSL